MANVAHKDLTGADLHEPKGVTSATSGTVYVANGSGSGSWSSIASVLNFVGMIADFTTPIAPSGWLECDGSAISRTTYVDLFTANTIQQTGTRTSGSASITGLTSTSNMKAGYKIGGTGTSVGTTILTIDSATSLTMSANATSSGSATIIVSPWGLGDNSTTFNLPDLVTNSAFRRTRNNTAGFVMGSALSDLIKSHSLTITDPGHVHGVTDPGHSHQLQLYGQTTNAGSGGAFIYYNTTVTASVGVSNLAITGISINLGTTGISSSYTGGSETRPKSVVVMTCVKY